MKKIVSLIVGLTMITGAVVSENKDIDKGNAFRINFNGDISVRNNWKRQGIPYTRKINGQYIRSWIQYPQPLKDSVMDNVDVVMQSEDGTFSDAKPLKEFSRTGLSNAYHVVQPYRSFAETDKDYGRMYPWAKYSADELSLVEQFKQEQCIQCKYPCNKEVIIGNITDLPHKVCNRYEEQRKKDFEAKVAKNIHRTWRQAEQDRKQQNNSKK